MDETTTQEEIAPRPRGRPRTGRNPRRKPGKDWLPPKRQRLEILTALMPGDGTPETRIEACRVGPKQATRILNDPSFEREIWQKVYREIFLPRIPELASKLMEQALHGKSQVALSSQKALLTLLADKSPIREKAGLSIETLSDEELIPIARQMREEFDSVLENETEPRKGES